jgi:hypothetical protein
VHLISSPTSAKSDGLSRHYSANVNAALIFPPGAPDRAAYVVSSSQGLFFVSAMKCIYRISESSGKRLV